MERLAPSTAFERSLPMDKKILLSTVLVPAIINSLSADQLPVFVVGMVVTYYLLKKDN